MIAMMTPSAAPMILLYARATRHAQAGGGLQHGRGADGSVCCWLPPGMARVLDRRDAAHVGAGEGRCGVRPSHGLDVRMAFGRVLIAAGLYQFSPLKHVCLRVCRAPAEFLSRHWRPGSFGALRMGLEHGVFCVGCCWVLMALLFVGGVMNPFGSPFWPSSCCWRRLRRWGRGSRASAASCCSRGERRR